MIQMICFCLSTHVNCFPVYTAGTSCPRNPWLTALSRVNMQHNVLDCGIVVNEFDRQSRYYVHFSNFRKVWTPLPPQLLFKSRHYWFTKVVLALNNPQRLLIKESKPNQTSLVISQLLKTMSMYSFVKHGLLLAYYRTYGNLISLIK